MKKTASLFVCFVMILTLLCACGQKEELGLVISLECDGENTWILQMQKQGVVDTVGEAQKDEATGDMMFVFEAVGEGETELDFYLVQQGEVSSENALRLKKYRVSVSSDFEITSEAISDEEITKPAVKLENKEDAEAYFEKNISDAFESKSEYVIKYIETYTENGLVWYKFSLSHILTLDSGETVLRFKQMYAVSENGEIKLLDEGKDTPDEILTLK